MLNAEKNENSIYQFYILKLNNVKGIKCLNDDIN